MTELLTGGVEVRGVKAEHDYDCKQTLEFKMTPTSWKPDQRMPCKRFYFISYYLVCTLILIAVFLTEILGFAIIIKIIVWSNI